MRVIDVARGPLVVVGPDTPLHHAARLMDVHCVDAVVVAEDGRPIGIVTERDLVVRGLARRLPGDSGAAAVMTGAPVTIDAGADAADAYRLLRDRTVHRLPVVAGGRLVAMVTLDDFAVEPPAELTRLVHTPARPENGYG
ncbi:MAG: CBS domain-containing protein [Actinomycetota bacterium]|jgi:CBS domain-containing protein